MKTIKIIFIGIIISVSTCFTYGQENVYFKAMQDELNRNIENLKLEGLQNPFFISYTLENNYRIDVNSTLGTILESVMKEKAIPSVRLMVGDYQLNDENFSDQSGFSFGGSFNSNKTTIEEDYWSIRRDFWLQTEKTYKSAAEKYEKKLSAIETQNLSEELKNLPDFTKVDPVVKVSKSAAYRAEKDKVDQLATELSSLFKGNAQITSSGVQISCYHSDIYLINNEGTKVKDVVNIVKVGINASSQATDGMIFDDELNFYANKFEELPSTEIMRNKIIAFIQHLVDLKNAPVLEDSYFGPVVINNSAVADLYSKKYFERSKMNAKRDQIKTNVNRGMPGGSGSNLGDKIDDDILPAGFNIVDDPSITEHNGIKTIGHFAVDGEGVEPKALKLIENGVLKTLYNNRTPSLKIAESNGHYRYKLGFTGLKTSIAPGVVKIDNDNAVHRKKLIKSAIKLAKKNGLDYYIEIEKMQSEADGSSSSGSVYTIFSGGGSKSDETNAFVAYKVFLKNGKRELLRPVTLKGVGGKLESVNTTTSSNYVHNTLKSFAGSGFKFIMISGASFEGTPSTFIVPETVLFERLKVEKQKILSTDKLPAVPNPII
jgi:hypothetical protein